MIFISLSRRSFSKGRLGFLKVLPVFCPELRVDLVLVLVDWEIFITVGSDVVHWLCGGEGEGGGAVMFTLLHLRIALTQKTGVLWRNRKPIEVLGAHLVKTLQSLRLTGIWMLWTGVILFSTLCFHMRSRIAWATIYVVKKLGKQIPCLHVSSFFCDHFENFFH